MAELDSQLRLASLLKYFRRGDFGMFRRATVLAGYLHSSDGPFAAADVLLACQMAGFIEVESSDGERRWWAVLDRAIGVRSPRPKLIPSRPDRSNAGTELRPLVHDMGGGTLIWGVNKSADIPAGSCDFGPGFLSRLPPLAAIEKQVTRHERLGGEFAAEHAEWFSPEDAGWRPVSTPEPPPHALLRLRREYGPWMYVVKLVEPHHGIFLADQEWALPIVRNMLGWPLSRFLRTEGNVTQIARAFRLPSLLLRFIFANAESVTLGPWLRVYGLNPRARDQLSDYLGEAG
jgi:hypothetical protein